MIHLIEAGHSYKVYGIKGEIIVDLIPQFRKHILKSGVLFFKLEGNAVPFFIKSISGSDDCMIKFKEVDTPEQARELSNQIMYIDDSGLKIEEAIIEEEVVNTGNSFLNFQIEDVASGFKGIIKDLEEFPSQLMALVEVNSKEYMVPLHQDWIEHIDTKNKIIRVKLPGGLFDL